MIETYQFYRSTSALVMELIAQGIGLPASHFESFFEPNTLSTLRLLHYPSRLHDKNIPNEARDGNVVITTGAHADSSMLTLLQTFDNQGLQVTVTFVSLATTTNSCMLTRWPFQLPGVVSRPMVRYTEPKKFFGNEYRFTSGVDAGKGVQGKENPV